MDDTWSPQEEATLVQLVETTKYRIIANKLGKTTNAVCAKVKRMRDLKEIPGSKMARPQKQTFRAGNSDPSDRPAADQTGFRNATRKMDEEAIELKGKLRSLTELPDDGCHFVVGDPRKTSKVYCPEVAIMPGVPGKCYCAKHMARIYNAPVVASARASTRQPVREAVLELVA